jgi:septum formation protein
MKHPLNLSGSLILGSASPRRASLLKGLGFTFEQINADVDESWPESLPINQIAEFLARKKSDALQKLFSLSEANILITADTTVILENTILNKPESIEEARQMLTNLAGHVHKVVTGVCVKNNSTQVSFSETSLVRVKPCSPELIEYYIHTNPPMDKAGAYGIQDFFGMAAIESIKGCYYNIMGLPTASLYEALKQHFYENA